MIPHLSIALGFSFLCACSSPHVAIETDVIEKLDLASFRNSTGPAREAGKHSFSDYGFTVVHSAQGRTYLEPTDGSWEMGFEILRSSPDSLDLCFFDIARNGGSYRSQSALLVRRKSSGRWTANEVEAGFPDCQNMAQ